MIRSSAKNAKTDAQLVADYKQTGDQACIEVLFNRYCHLVFAVAMKYLHQQDESKDAVIDIFEKVPADLKRYEIKNFSHWIYIVTKNYCFQLLKKRKHNLSPEVLDYSTQVDWTDPADEVDFGKLLIDHLEESLKSLNDDQRICVQLFYLEEKSYEEVEQRTGYTYKQVKSHIQNGKRNLRIFLERFLK
ncbi:sigma-70 family RNA polymerase sigma factor [soil metagenome]